MFKELFCHRENCVEIAGLLLSRLEVNVTEGTLSDDLQSHPFYPSLLSISDVFSSYGVANISFKGSIEKVEEIHSPFIAQIKLDSIAYNVFTVVQYEGNGIINYFRPDERRFATISLAEFKIIWRSSVMLLAEPNENAGEKDFKQKKLKEHKNKVAGYAAFSSIPVLVFLTSVFKLYNYGFLAVYPVIYFVFFVVGTVTALLLLLYELDQHNPMLSQLCTSGKMINCGAVLNSRASKIAGISWSAIGFTYFSGGTLLLFFSGINMPNALFFLSWTNLLTVPYILFSLYYQWRIAKQWCLLCLSTQAILLSQVFISILAGWHRSITLEHFFSTEFIMSALFSYSIIIVGLNIVLPAFRKTKEGRKNKIELQRLKQNPQIFNTLLSKQKHIKEQSESLGIILGNPNATNKIIKVCNPYCNPCARAHFPIEELLKHNPDLQVQIIFNATNSEEDIRAAPVKHLLAIAEKEVESITKQALDSWYSSKKKNYEQFASRYPMNGELKKQDEKLEAMNDWCRKMEISHTPTFFINGHELPDIYTVNDLKYFVISDKVILK